MTIAIPKLPPKNCIVAAATVAAFWLNSASASETNRQRYIDPAEIDRAISEFTGAAIGEVGGARLPSDRRMRLASCNAPLALDWHGTARTIVKVSCSGPESWRIFIATRAPTPDAANAPVIGRGDPVTVVIRGRGFTVQQSGEAMESGALGDWIAIRTERRANPIRARIERPGLAVIPAN